MTTQATRLGIVRSFHRFLKRRGLAMANPAAALPLPRLDQRRVRKDFLTLQEAQAVLTTAAADVDAVPRGSKTWATALRDLAMLALAIATARRSAGLCHLLVGDLNVERQGLRVSREKGFAGRVLPVVPWAVAVVQAYRDTARPVLLGPRTSPWLFVGQRAERIGQRTWDAIVRRVHRDTCAACPDLTNLPGKTVSTQSLRVTTARLLFLGGCPIRVINELLLHRLFDPPFDSSNLEPGYIKGYAPGVRENGGQYTHAAVWVAMAFARAGDAAKAWELFAMLNPVNHGGSADTAAVYRVEPYVVAADIYGVAPHIGRGGWSWYTGSAGWLHRLLIEDLLGVRREGDHLVLTPRPPPGWAGYTVHYRHYSTIYHIVVTCAGDETVMRSMRIDGRDVALGMVPLVDDGQDHRVDVELG